MAIESNLFKKKKVRSSLSAFSPVVYKPVHLRLRGLTVGSPQLSAALFCSSGCHSSVLHGLHSSGLKVSKGEKAMCTNSSSGLKTYSLQPRDIGKNEKSSFNCNKRNLLFFPWIMEKWRGGRIRGWHLLKICHITPDCQKILFLQE